MLDPKLIRSDPQAAKEGLEKRKIDPSLIDKFLTLDEKWRSSVQEVDALKAKKNSASDQIGKLKRKGDLLASRQESPDKLMVEMKVLAEKITKAEKMQRQTEEKLNAVALEIPNLPHSSVPIGTSCELNPGRKFA